MVPSAWDTCFREPFTLPEFGEQPGWITFWPHIHGTDGFFVAKLRRKGDTHPQPIPPRLEQLDLVGVDIAGDHLALVIHVDGGGEGLAPRRGAAVQHPAATPGPPGW